MAESSRTAKHYPSNATLPTTRIATRMIHCNDGDLVVVNSIDDGIGESSYKGKLQVLEDLSMEAWHPLNQIESLFDAKQEVVAQPRSLIVVPRFRRGQVVLRLD